MSDTNQPKNTSDSGLGAAGEVQPQSPVVNGDSAANGFSDSVATGQAQLSQSEQIVLPQPKSAVKLFSVTTWLVAILVTVLGILGLVFPEQALLLLALLIGIYLAIAGAVRIFLALRAPHFSTPIRWIVGILGGLVAVAGVLAIISPTVTLIALAIVIGAGWIVDGVAYFTTFILNRDSNGKRQWELLVFGVLITVSGFIVISLPGLSLVSLVLWVSILLLVTGAATLIWLLSATVTERQLRREVR